MKVVKEIIVFFVCQLGIALVSHKVLWEVLPYFFTPRNSDMFWGMRLQIAFWVFLGISIGNALIFSYLKTMKTVMSLVILECLIFTAFFFTQYRPFRSLLLVVCAWCGWMLAGWIKSWWIKRSHRLTRI